MTDPTHRPVFGKITPGATAPGLGIGGPGSVDHAAHAHAHAPAPPPAVVPPPAPAPSAGGPSPSPGRAGARPELSSLMTSDETLQAALRCKYGDVLLTEQRVLVETRAYAFFELVVASSSQRVIRLADVGQVRVGRTLRPLHALVGVLLLLGGAGGVVGGAFAGGSNPAEVMGLAAGGLVIVAVGVLVLLASRAMSITIGAGSGAVGFVVKRKEGAAAQAFARQFGSVLR